MKTMNTPLEYAKAACETLMRKFHAEDLPPKGKFHYHQGVFLSGMYQTYLLCKDERYLQYIKAWVDSVVDAEGDIPSVHQGWMDDIQPGILLFPLLDQTGDARYQIALEKLMRMVADLPRNEVGGFWHKDILPEQMWLDGLYMVGPICAEYARRFEQPQFLDMVVQQARLMEAHTRDKTSGLWYHAWDAARRQDWADAETGLSPEFWGRSMGWVTVALLDDMDHIDPIDPRYAALLEIETRLLQAVLRYQSDEGRWYQVVDKASQPDNWLENSCSCLFTAAICKAVRKGILPQKHLADARNGYDAVIASLAWDDADLLIGQVCVGTDVGNYQHYCARPVSTNDLHGVGAFLLMCAEMEQSH